MEKLFIFPLTLVLAFATPAYAQQNCAPNYQKIAQFLKDEYKEIEFFRGLNEDETMSTLFLNQETGTWTMVISHATGTSCVVLSGEAGGSVPIPANGTRM